MTRLTGETILCFAPDPWSGLWRNRHQIMTRLAAHNTVVYVEPRTYLREAGRRVCTGQLGWAQLRQPLLNRADSGVWLYHDPVFAPYAGRLSGGRLTAAIRRRALRDALARLGARSPILWLLRPFHADQIGQYKEKLVVYHVTDEYAGFPVIVNKVGFKADEERLLRRADLVIVTSPALLAAKRPYNPQTHLVRNGVDYVAFQRTLASGNRLSRLGDAAGDIPYPRIGYVGALNEKVDFELLRRMAELRPDWQFVLVGVLDLVTPDAAATALKTLRNVHWLGRVPVDDVPLAIAGMDVCLLPYKMNAWTAHIDSLKLYEYLACARPVVSSDVPAVDDFRSLVRVADQPENFLREIEAALHEEPGAALDAARRTAAAANTWDIRVAQIEWLLQEALTVNPRAHLHGAFS